MNSRPQLTTASLMDIGRSTVSAFGEDRVGRHAAALAYYTVFAISPLLVVLISIAALYFHDEAQSIGAIRSQIQETVGPTAAQAIEQMIQGSNDHGGDKAKPIFATVVALAVALWGASGLFGALQDSLNAIWNVMPKPGLGIMATVRNRFISFAMVLTIGFLLLVSLIASTALSALAHGMNSNLGDSYLVGQALNIVLGLVFSTLLFAAIFKVLPDAKINWQDVWVGAFVTAALFTAGRMFLSWFLARPGTASPYGSAGALVVLLLWVNYASTILFFGAEFTKAYANKLGSKIEPDTDAVAVIPAHPAPDEKTPVAGKGIVGGNGSTTGSKSGAVTAAAAENTSPKTSPQNAAKAAASKQEFEFTLSVVAGAIAIFLWAIRKKAKEDKRNRKLEELGLEA